MRKIFLTAIITTICIASACSEKRRIPEAFIGTWRCDEALTLDSLSTSELVAPGDFMFEDNFFGDRVFVFRASEYMAYWVGKEWEDVDQEYVWFSYDLVEFVEFGPDSMTLRSPDTGYGNVEQYTWHIDGDLAYVEHEKWGFREYYRRIAD